MKTAPFFQVAPVVLGELFAKSCQGKAPRLLLWMLMRKEYKKPLTVLKVK